MFIVLQFFEYTDITDMAWSWRRDSEKWAPSAFHFSLSEENSGWQKQKYLGVTAP
jgi:hypothetical protein